MLPVILFILVWSWWSKSRQYAKNGADGHACHAIHYTAIHYEFSNSKLCLYITYLLSIQLC